MSLIQNALHKHADDDEGSEKKPKLADKRLQSQFSEEQVEMLAEKVGIDDDDKELMKEFEMGLEVEREHADVVDGNEVKLAKIVKAHLDEMRNYYTELSKMEQKHAGLRSHLKKKYPLHADDRREMAEIEGMTPKSTKERVHSALKKRYPLHADPKKELTEIEGKTASLVKEAMGNNKLQRRYAATKDPSLLARVTQQMRDSSARATPEGAIKSMRHVKKRDLVRSGKLGQKFFDAAGKGMDMKKAKELAAHPGVAQHTKRILRMAGQ